MPFTWEIYVLLSGGQSRSECPSCNACFFSNFDYKQSICQNGIFGGGVFSNPTGLYWGTCTAWTMSIFFCGRMLFSLTVQLHNWEHVGTVKVNDVITTEGTFPNKWIIPIVAAITLLQISSPSLSTSHHDCLGEALLCFQLAGTTSQLTPKCRQPRW